MGGEPGMLAFGSGLRAQALKELQEFGGDWVFLYTYVNVAIVLT